MGAFTALLGVGGTALAAYCEAGLIDIHANDAAWLGTFHFRLFVQVFMFMTS
jgi:hypothetical protein